jgi:hypothetical protein
VLSVYRYDGLEAKSAGGEIDANDVSNIQPVADQLKKIGERAHLIFSKASDAFTKAELDLFVRARMDGESLCRR